MNDLADLSERLAAPIDAEALAAFAAQQCPDVLVVVDPEGAVRFASESVVRVLGYTMDQHLGAAIWDFVHPDDLVAAAGAVSEASRTTGYHLPTVFRVHHHDGRWIECEVNGLTVDASDGSWMVLAIRATDDRDELMGRRRRIEQLIRMASLECSSVPWENVDSLVERYLQDLAEVVGAELVELAWEESDSELQIGARWPVVRMSSTAAPAPEVFVPIWPLDDTAAQLLHFTTQIDQLPDSVVRDRLMALRSEAVVEVPLSPRAPWAAMRLVFGPQWRCWDDANVDLVVVLASDPDGDVASLPGRGPPARPGPHRPTDRPDEPRRAVPSGSSPCSCAGPTTSGSRRAQTWGSCTATWITSSR